MPDKRSHASHAPVVEQSHPAPARKAPIVSRNKSAAEDEPEEWRDWSGPTRVASFRLPDELLEELTNTAARLGLPMGQTVIAALTSLLDEDDDALTAQIDRAAQTLARGKRQARRRKLLTQLP